MFRNIIITILLLTLFSCTQYTATTAPELDYTLTLENAVVGISLYEIDRQVFIKNDSSNLAIEIDYNINDSNIIVYDAIVPNEEIFIYNWYKGFIDITINNVRFY